MLPCTMGRNICLALCTILMNSNRVNIPYISNISENRCWGFNTHGFILHTVFTVCTVANFIIGIFAVESWKNLLLLDSYVLRYRLKRLIFYVNNRNIHDMIWSKNQIICQNYFSKNRNLTNFEENALRMLIF